MKARARARESTAQACQMSERLTDLDGLEALEARLFTALQNLDQINAQSRPLGRQLARVLEHVANLHGKMRKWEGGRR